jgi:hypothetical protein
MPDIKNEDIEPRKAFLRALKEAKELVDSWPKWKQNILENSGKSTVDVPRKPVINDDGF